MAISEKSSNFAPQKHKINIGIMKIPGLSFSLKRAVGITKVKQSISRATGIPTTKQGLERKIGSKILKPFK